MAHLDKRFLKINPGQLAEGDGNNQHDERKPDVVPGAEPWDAPKEHAQEELVKQVSAVCDDAKCP
jgi:hypothetical protein